ncbi:anti-sigma factor domain-containing protein [Dactylosporangium sp. CS-033363]|uniref:anti-sigma factor n=1 Tax=Dactylosporangium sp. CS-033363 TaxID=3239935 RepID=UPI003D8C5BD4
MPHLEPERLVLLALGEEMLDQHETGHLDVCEQCRAEMDSLRIVAGLGRQTSRLRDLPPPPEHVWHRIRAELAASDRALPPPAVTLHTDPPPPRPAANDHQPHNNAANQQPHNNAENQEPYNAEDQQPHNDAENQEPYNNAENQQPYNNTEDTEPYNDAEDQRPRNNADHRPYNRLKSTDQRPPNRTERKRPTWLRTAAVAVAAALVAAAGTALWLGRGDAGPQCRAQDARVRLEALPDAPSGASGYACLRVVDGQRRLIVHTEGMPTQADGDYEAWLLDRDEPTVRMEALGVVAQGKTEPALAVPDSLDLTRYNIIDISAEPHDGNAAHSGRSMLRGTLR